MANLIKFFRVEALPTTGVVGGLYFVHGGEIAAGNGKLYVCTAENTFELYSGVNESELSTKLDDYVLKTQTIAGIDLKDDILASELMIALKSLLDNSVQEGKFITGFTVNEQGKLEATYEAVETTDTTYAFESAADANNSGAYFTVTEEGKDPLTVYVNADLAGTAATLINALDLEDEAVEGKYVASVSQVNGQISVTRADLPTFTESADVDSLDGKTGVITTLKNQETIGAINLEVDANNQLKATLVGSFEDGAQVNKVEGVTLNDTDVVGVDKIARIKAIEGIVENDKVLSLNGHNIMSTLSLDYVTEGEGEAAKKYIVLKGIDGVEIDKIDASDFIADSFLDNVEIKPVDGKDILYFTWAMADGTTKTDSVDLSKYINIYTGADKQIVVSEGNVIGLAEHKAEATTGEALTPVHGGTFNVITGVSTDDYGRVNSVETSQVTLPTIADGDKTGSDDYVSVQVKTAAGAVSEVIVNTDELSTKISGIEADLTEVAQVTAAALVDLNSRLDGVEAGTIKSVTGEDAELNNTAYVNVKATTENGAVTLASSVKAVEATEPAKYPSTGLATDGYVNEKVATVAATAGTAVQNIDSEAKTIQVTRAKGSNDVNLELVWAAF